MNVASLELCKTLHELSGWEPWLEGNAVAWYDENGELRRSSSSVYTIPAYDLGYLLRKLPNHITLSHDETTYRVIHEASSTSPAYAEYADTPEDAACKLAIRLFKQGVLTREDE